MAQNLGAGKTERVQKTFRSSLVLMLAMGLLSGLVMYLTAGATVGFMLFFEGLHPFHHSEIPKGYAYVAMAFSFGVELLNMRSRKHVVKLNK